MIPKILRKGFRFSIYPFSFLKNGCCKRILYIFLVDWILLKFSNVHLHHKINVCIIFWWCIYSTLFLKMGLATCNFLTDLVKSVKTSVATKIYIAFLCQFYANVTNQQLLNNIKKRCRIGPTNNKHLKLQSQNFQHAEKP